MSWPMARLDGRRGFKLVPGRFPPMRHFQRIADARDLATLDAVDAMTDDQARDEIGQIGLVPANGRLSGGDAAPVMAAFTCFAQAGSLFSEGSYGVFYLQLETAAAISEARWEMSAFLAATGEKPARVRMGLYSFGLTGEVADLREVEGIDWHIGARDACLASRTLGKRLRAAGMAGALYPNAHRQEADSLAVFRTSALTDSIRCAIIECSWNGVAIDRVETLPDAEVCVGKPR